MGKRLLVLGMVLLLACCDGGGAGTSAPTGAGTTRPAADSTVAAPAVKVELVRAVALDLDARFHAVGVGVDRGGSAYVANTVRHRVEVFDAGGRPLRSWGGKGAAAGKLRFYQTTRSPSAGSPSPPTAPCTSATAATTGCRCSSPDGTLRFLWGEPGDGPGDFAEPGAVALGPGGEVHVVDTRLARLQVFRRRG
jgi:hypothetical protein